MLIKFSERLVISNFPLPRSEIEAVLLNPAVIGHQSDAKRILHPVQTIVNSPRRMRAMTTVPALKVLGPVHRLPQPLAAILPRGPLWECIARYLQ
jgi:hypothetical protein